MIEVILISLWLAIYCLTCYQIQKETRRLEFESKYLENGLKYMKQLTEYLEEQNLWIL